VTLRVEIVHLVRANHSEHFYIPTADNLFLAWLKDKGWTAQLSPPGILAKQIYKTLGGHLGGLLNEKLLGVFESMNGGKPNDENEPLAEERHLPVGEIKSKTGDAYQYLLERGVFRAGVKMQCSICFRHSWYPLDDLKDRCKCPKCLAIFSAVGNVDKAQWSYKTAGSFSVPRYADGAFSVLLGMDFFNNHRLGSLSSFSPIFSFIAKNAAGKNLEADFAGFWKESMFKDVSEGLLFAECKSYNHFQARDFDRMASIAKDFPGAIITFCTLRKELSLSEIKGIKKLAKSGRKEWKSEEPLNPILILTGNELFSYHPPPYCWEDPIKKQFDRLHGLLELCNATQQIYLGLPSWHTEWHQKVERDRAKDEGNANIKTP
jgi:hypothetical protein